MGLFNDKTHFQYMRIFRFASQSLRTDIYATGCYPPGYLLVIAAADMFSSLIFYPSLGYNLLRNRLQPTSWAWYNRIDDSLLVGALPFQSMIPELRKENVGGIVCCTEEFETKSLPTTMTKEAWEDEQFKFHAVPMQDFTGTTSRQNIQSAVEFMEEIASTGKTVYVHCKAGRTRSATVAISYLMKRNDWAPNVAFEHLKSKRPQVLLRSAHWRTVNEYRRFLDSLKQQNSKLSV
uniref:Phosphatidylglycerophosphatase and protein-tyrosine phosphatase 1 n=1 Tax=Steinernema glaseri TaxID=37863 RepID=A0A1I7ZJY4_9BILA